MKHLKFTVSALALVAVSATAQTTEEMQATIDQQQAVIETLSSQVMYIQPTTNVQPIPAPDTLVEVTSPRAAVVNREARLASQVYVTEVPNLSQVQSKPFAVPPGWEMVEQMQPDKIICSAYPQASTWQLVQLVQPVTIQPVPKVTQGQEDSITILTEDTLLYVEGE